MEVFYVLLGAVSLILLFPRIRCCFKRIISSFQIRRICQKKGYRLYQTHFLWFLGRKHAKKCDFYIETPSEVFAVKFFGMPRRSTVLIFRENGAYFIRRFIVFIAYGGAVLFPFDSKLKRMPVYDFHDQYQKEWEIKKPRRILLVNPVSMEFRRQPEHGEEVIVGAGDIVNGMEIDSLSRFLGDLENARSAS